MLVRPGESGVSVAALQQLLTERGLLPPDADSEVRANTYGPVTVGAIKTFQAKHHLTVDAIVGPQTWAALQGDGDQANEEVPEPDYAGAGAFAGAVLSMADAELRLGVAEQPLGSNRGMNVDQYITGLRGDGTSYLHYRQTPPAAADGWQGIPWCGRFALWCVERAAAQLQTTPPTNGWSDLASALKWYDQAYAHGKLTPEPKAGRVGVIIIQPAALGASAHGHVILVANTVQRPDGLWLATREGNTANRVGARWRKASSITAFVDLG